MVNADELHPTQKNVGLLEVAVKRAEIDSFDFKKQRRQYLKKRLVPVVIGPKNRFYIIDRHHMSRALLDSGYKKIYVEIQKDWSDLSQKEFWEKMEKNGFVYLYDENRRKISVDELPTRLIDLGDDLYRSLAYFAREAGAYKKMNTPFIEFVWAEFYKQSISPESIVNNLDEAVQEAILLSRSPLAKKIPGFIGNKKKCAEISL